jgi:hypothetical protein
MMRMLDVELLFGCENGWQDGRKRKKSWGNQKHEGIRVTSLIRKSHDLSGLPQKYFKGLLTTR